MTECWSQVLAKPQLEYYIQSRTWRGSHLFLFYYYYLGAGGTYGMQDLSSPTRDRTHAPCIGITESHPLDHQGSPMTWSQLHTKNAHSWDFPGGPVAKTLCSQCRGPGQGARSHTLRLKIPRGGEKGTLLHCWWECKLVQPLWKTVWRFLKKLETELPYDPAIPLLGIHTEETRGKETRVPQCSSQHCL